MDLPKYYTTGHWKENKAAVIKEYIIQYDYLQPLLTHGHEDPGPAESRGLVFAQPLPRS